MMMQHRSAIAHATLEHGAVLAVNSNKVECPHGSLRCRIAHHSAVEAAAEARLTKTRGRGL